LTENVPLPGTELCPLNDLPEGKGRVFT